MADEKLHVYPEAAIPAKLAEHGLTGWYLEDGWLRRKYATDRREDRQDGRTRIRKLAGRHLAPDFESNEKKEDRQQAFGEPGAHGHRPRPPDRLRERGPGH